VFFDGSDVQNPSSGSGTASKEASSATSKRSCRAKRTTAAIRTRAATTSGCAARHAGQCSMVADVSVDGAVDPFKYVQSERRDGACVGMIGRKKSRKESIKDPQQMKANKRMYSSRAGGSGT